MYTQEELYAFLPRLRLGKVYVLGDAMLDAYWSGDASRLSPEAPVPVVKMEKKQHFLGGAGNVARNISALGGHAELVALAGDDTAGREMQKLLETANVRHHLIRAGNRPTTIKTRIFARNQQMLRLDEEVDTPLNTAETAALQAVLAQVAEDCSTGGHNSATGRTGEIGGIPVFLISDYGKGLVDSALLPAIRQYVPHARVLVDPKPQNKVCYQQAFLLTPNQKETAELANMPARSKAELLLAGSKLREELQAPYLLSTLGADGMALFSPLKGVLHIETAAREVFDISGAGDTVIATLALALSCGIPIEAACLIANYAAGIVVGKIGAATATQEEIHAAIKAEEPRWEFWE